MNFLPAPARVSFLQLNITGRSPAEPPSFHRRSIGKLIVEGRMLFIPPVQSDSSRESTVRTAR